MNPTQIDATATDSPHGSPETHRRNAISTSQLVTANTAAYTHRRDIPAAYPRRGTTVPELNGQQRVKRWAQALAAIERGLRENHHIWRQTPLRLDWAADILTDGALLKNLRTPSRSPARSPAPPGPQQLVLRRHTCTDPRTGRIHELNRDHVAELPLSPVRDQHLR
ncbi:hypothetical protein [Streptomyces sp. WAC 06725]|uniref:hypothetical protein n=1 Tax=Streptomyces sp. WAC 06725 TaxID=2203209 RepID=UPI000F73BD46|nr:hypothetical protein [Streptomyces sp. WAC 06725]